MKMISDTDLLSDVNEGRGQDRPEVLQLGELMERKAKLNEARREAMKSPGYHPAMFNRGYRGITG